MKTQLLVIDPQNDFCLPASHPLAAQFPVVPYLPNNTRQGALFVQNADQDCLRLAKFIDRSLDFIDDIRVTLDSHQPVHIAHAISWIDAQGNHPGPFTLIQVADVEGQNAKWRASNPTWQQRQVDYVKALAAGGRYVLVIWPPHCLISTIGHAVFPELGESLRKWQDQFAMIDYVTKGSNPFTEHYSVVKADVVDPTDPTTDINKGFIDRLQEADQILIAGQALSHCVANSVRDIAAEFGDAHIKKLVLLEDTTSPVGDQGTSTMFADMAAGFIKEMVGRGMRVAKTTDF